MERQFLERKEFNLAQEAERTALGKDILHHQEARLDKAKDNLNKKHVREFQAFHETRQGIYKAKDQDKAKTKTKSQAKTRTKAPDKSPQKSKGKDKGKDMDLT